MSIVYPDKMNERRKVWRVAAGYAIMSLSAALRQTERERKVTAMSHRNRMELNAVPCSLRAQMESVLELAHANGCAVYGKCVETEDEAALLRELGASRLQGRFYCDALYFDEVLERMEGAE